jgi:hypothetical protein
MRLAKKKGAETWDFKFEFLTSLPFLTVSNGFFNRPQTQRKRKDKKRKKTKKKNKKSKKLFPSADPEGGVRDAPRHLAE